MTTCVPELRLVERFSQSGEGLTNAYNRLPDTVSSGCRVRGRLPAGKRIAVTTPSLPLDAAAEVEEEVDELEVEIAAKYVVPLSVCTWFAAVDVQNTP